jgi:hypothetical protein
VKSASEKLFLDLHTVSAPSGEERTLGASAQVERAERCCRRFDSGTHAWCGHATVMVLVPSASGPRVSGCPRAPLNFNPHPVYPSAKHPKVAQSRALCTFSRGPVLATEWGKNPTPCAWQVRLSHQSTCATWPDFRPLED